MKRFLGKFSVVFGIWCGVFSFLGCSTPNFIWSTQSGIVTYNRHTGQFELLWENKGEAVVTVHDTVFVCPDDTITKP